MALNSIDSKKIPPWKTLDKLREILKSRKFWDNSFVSNIVNLQKVTKLSSENYYKLVFSQIFFTTEPLSKFPNKIERWEFDTNLAKRISDSILLPLLKELSKFSLTDRIKVLKWFTTFSNNFDDLFKNKGVSNYYKVSFTKWETLEVTLSRILTQCALYLTFWKIPSYYDKWLQSVTKPDIVPFLDFNELEKLTKDELEILSNWTKVALKYYYERINRVKSIGWTFNQWFLDTHLLHDKKSNSFRLTSFLFKKWLWTVQSFKEDWFYDMVKNTQIWSNTSSVERARVINLYMKWNPKN